MIPLTAAERDVAEKRLEQIALALAAMQRVRGWDLHAEHDLKEKRDRLMAQLRDR